MIGLSTFCSIRLPFWKVYIPCAATKNDPNPMDNLERFSDNYISKVFTGLGSWKIFHFVWSNLKNMA